MSKCLSFIIYYYKILLLLSSSSIVIIIVRWDDISMGERDLYRISPICIFRSREVLFVRGSSRARREQETPCARAHTFVLSCPPFFFKLKQRGSLRATTAHASKNQGIYQSKSDCMPSVRRIEAERSRRRGEARRIASIHIYIYEYPPPPPPPPPKSARIRKNE